jgi:hypothetical protein
LGVAPILNPTQISAINQYAGQAGLSTATAVNLAGQLANDAPAVLNAIKAAQGGNSEAAYMTIAPLIGGAVALINPIAGAVVGGVLAIAGVVLTDLGILGSPKVESCTWKFPPTAPGRSGACFNMPRPYGPSSPEWVSLGKFANSYSNPNNPWNDVYWYPQYANPSWLDDTVMNDGSVPGTTDIYGTGTTCSYFCGPGWLIAPELSLLGDLGPIGSWWGSAHSTNLVGQILGEGGGVSQEQNIAARLRSFWGFERSGVAPSTTNPGALWRWTTPGLQAFALVFNRAWQGACEYPINGYAMPSAYSLLSFIVGAWNNLYPNGTPVPIDGSLAADGYPLSFADAVVLGIVDQWETQASEPSQNPPLSVNDPGTGLASVVSSVPTSTALIVAGTVGAAAIGAAAWSLITKRSLLSLLGG